jgi:kynurenine formamidase
MTRIVDLTVEQYEGNGTHPVHGRTPLILPGTVSHWLSSQRGVKNVYDGSRVSAVNELILMSGHTGTHLDSPFHVDHKAETTIEKVPLEKTYGPGVWLDLSDKREPEATIDPDDLARAEQSAGVTIEAGETVLLHTGWHDVEENDLSLHPYLTREAAEWLRERAITGLGVDFNSPDGTCAPDLPVHMNFLRPRSLDLPDDAYILIYENLRNVAGIRARRFTFSGLPLPFRGAGASPVRAVAFVE